MTNISRKIFLGSLTSLTVMASSLAFAEEMVTAPSFEGGVTASIGTFYVVPSSEDSTIYAIADFTEENGIEEFNTFSTDSDYGWGYDASLGYLFEDTANGIELSYRGLDNSSSSHTDEIILENAELTGAAEDKLHYILNSADLMVGQYMDIGTHMQVRITGGLSYLDLEQKQNISTNLVETVPSPSGMPGTYTVEEKSKFTGWGPRVGMDARYDFGEGLAGFGIVGGASLAYFLGTIDFTGSFTTPAGAINAGADSTNVGGSDVFAFSQKLDNQSVTNLRANLGIDYVYFFDNEERSTLGIELGYLVDFYDNAAAFSNDAAVIAEEDQTSSVLDVTTGGAGAFGIGTEAITFSGPYVSLKGVF